MSKARLRVDDCFDMSLDESIEDFEGHSQQRYRTIPLWVPQLLFWLRDRSFWCSSPDFWNFGLALGLDYPDNG